MSDESNTSVILSDGDSPIGFDMFESLETPTTTSKEVETKSETEEPKVVETKTTEEKTTVAANEESDENKKVETKEAKADETADEGDNTVKTLKFKVGPRGKEVEIPEDAKISITTEGGEVEMTLSEAKAQISGKIDYTKKYSEFEEERKAFDADRKESETKLNSILDKVYDQQDAAGAILEMCQIAELDPGPVFQAFQKAVIGDLDKFLEMTDLERENYLLKQERDFLTQNKKASQEAVKKQQEVEQTKAQVNKMREELDVNDEWMGKAKKQMESNPEAFKSWLKGQKPTMQHVLTMADIMERHELAEKILKKVDPELAKDDAAIAIAVEKLKGNKRIPLDEAVSYAAKLFGRTSVAEVKEEKDAVKKTLADKIKKTSEADDEEDAQNSKGRRKAAKDEDDEPLFFSDM